MGLGASNKLKQTLTHSLHLQLEWSDFSGELLPRESLTLTFILSQSLSLSVCNTLFFPKGLVDSARHQRTLNLKLHHTETPPWFLAFPFLLVLIPSPLLFPDHGHEIHRNHQRTWKVFPEKSSKTFPGFPWLTQALIKHFYLREPRRLKFFWSAHREENFQNDGRILSTFLEEVMLPLIRVLRVTCIKPTTRSKALFF